MKFASFISSFDYLSNEVKLTISNRETRLKTVVGGLLSLIAIGTLLCFGLFFFVKLLQKESIFVTASMEYTNNSTLTDSQNFPFLLRLTDKSNRPFEDPDSIYTVSLKYWYNDNTNQELVEQKTIDIDVEPCDINKHFSYYKELFEDLNDLSTFYCVNPRLTNMSIYGQYGNIYPFGYYHFYMTLCTGKSNCLDKESLQKVTENVYMDFRTVDFSMDSNSKKAKVDSIHSDRHMLSSTVYKRIWFYLDGVKYITDDGLFFMSESTEEFSKFSSMRYDIDLRDIFTGTIPGTFATMTILNSGTVYIYNRKYLKLQDYLASVGGIITFVQIIASLLNYTFALNTYYLSFMDQMPMFQSMIKGGTDRLKGEYLDDKNSIKPFRINVNLHQNAALNDSRKELPDFNSRSRIGTAQYKRDNVLLEKVKKWHNRLFPFVCYPKPQAEILAKCIDQICDHLNVMNILTRIEDSRILIREIFPEVKKNKMGVDNFVPMNMMDIAAFKKVFPTDARRMKFDLNKEQ